MVFDVDFSCEKICIDSQTPQPHSSLSPFNFWVLPKVRDEVTKMSMHKLL